MFESRLGRRRDPLASRSCSVLCVVRLGPSSTCRLGARLSEPEGEQVGLRRPGLGWLPLPSRPLREASAVELCRRKVER